MIHVYKSVCIFFCRRCSTCVSMRVNTLSLLSVELSLLCRSLLPQVNRLTHAYTSMGLWLEGVQQWSYLSHHVWYICSSHIVCFKCTLISLSPSGPGSQPRTSIHPHLISERELSVLKSKAHLVMRAIQLKIGHDLLMQVWWSSHLTSMHAYTVHVYDSHFYFLQSSSLLLSASLPSSPSSFSPPPPPSSFSSPLHPPLLSCHHHHLHVYSSLSTPSFSSPSYTPCFIRCSTSS